MSSTLTRDAAAHDTARLRGRSRWPARRDAGTLARPSRQQMIDDLIVLLGRQIIPCD